MTRLIARLTDAFALIAGAALVLMMLHVTADVIGKYLLLAPIPGTSEVVASYYMIATVFLPLAYIELQRRPIVVELFYDLLPKSAQPAIDVLGALASIAFYLFLAWQSWLIAVGAYQIGETVEGAWRVTVWPSRFMLPLGLALAAAVLALRLADGLRPAGRKPRMPAPAAE